MVKKEETNIEETQIEEQKLQDLFQGLEDVIRTMEQPDISLEESFQMYHKGIDLLKICNDKIDKIEKKMLVLDNEGEVHEFE